MINIKLTDFNPKKLPLRFYVYAYVRSIDSLNGKKGTPYYIGKGSKDRAWRLHSHIKKPKNYDSIIIIKDNLTEFVAHSLEMWLIKLWGRLNIKTGILHNKTDGGEGISGFKHSEETKRIISECNKNRSKETRQKLSLSQKNRIYSEEFKEKMKIIARNRPPKSEETRKKLSIANTGKTHSENTKIKMSKIKKGIPKPKIQCPYCKLVGGTPQMKRYHFNNCKLK